MCDNDRGEAWAREPFNTLAERIKNMAGNDWPWRLNPPDLLSLPAHVTRKVLSFAFDGDGRPGREERACNCIDLKLWPDRIFPFRRGPTIYLHDMHTQCNVVKAESECPLDQKSGVFRSWCVKQYLARRPGQKRRIPAMAATCKRLYRDWRDLTIWVFCTEYCMENALRKLPYGNTRLMTHVRLFERSNEKNIPYIQGTWGLRREAYLDGTVQYEVGENQELGYRGRIVLVKDLKLQMFCDEI